MTRLRAVGSRLGSRRVRAVALAALSMLPCLAARAASTTIDVYVISQGAKFIGSGVGGARVVIENAVTGERLADGTTTGGTGDTMRIMGPSPRRGEALTTAGTARFRATVELDGPTRLRAIATAPIVNAQAANTVTATRWVLPGVGVTGGDGWLLEMPGLAVDIRTPRFPDELDGVVKIEAVVTMMCGCPITPDGIWDAADFEVQAVARPETGAPPKTLTLDYAGKASHFSGVLEGLPPGPYELTVTAHEKANGNAGVDTTTFTLRPGG